MIKPDWNIFRAKFSEDPQGNFEWFCYLLFCQEHQKPLGIFRYMNQAALETDPVKIGNDVIGWQAKFYNSTLSDHKRELISAIATSKTRWPGLTKIIFYSNEQWSQGKKANDPKAKSEAEEIAKKLGVQLEWRTASFFESQFVTVQNELTSKHFFTLGTNVVDIIKQKKVHTQTILYDINTSITYGSKTIELDRSEVLAKICEHLLNVRITLLGGVAGVGKTAVVKKLYEQLKAQFPIYVFKASEFNVVAINELFKPCTLQEFIDAHKEEQSKIIVVDSAEKLLDLSNKDLILTPYCRQREKPVYSRKEKLAWNQRKGERNTIGSSRSML